MSRPGANRDKCFNTVNMPRDPLMVGCFILFMVTGDRKVKCYGCHLKYGIAHAYHMAIRT